MEGTSLDGATLQYDSLRRVQLVEPRCQERLDSRRHLDRRIAGVADEREHFFEEERIALRHLHDPFVQILRQVAELREQSLRLGCVERLEQHGRRIPLAAAPGRTAVQKLRPWHTQEQE